jgi:predicted nucleic acid-binding Zn ribbon protein
MFKSLHHILDVIENQPGWEVQQQFRLILAQWSGVVGATVADHTRPTAIDRAVLWVATSSPIWAQELTFKRHLILQKLNERLSTRLGEKPLDGKLASNLNSNLSNLDDRLLPLPKNPLPPNQSGNPQPMKLFEIKDIKFSPGQWRPRFDDASPVAANHPSYLPPKIKQRSAPSLKPVSPDTSSNPEKSDQAIKSDKSPQSLKASINAQAWWQEVQERSIHLPLCSQCHCPTPPGEIDRWSCCALCATKKWSR